jgi:dTDP-4-dehydrorhamnose reductase
VTARLGRLPLELWAGVECTVNRVGDAFFDQTERSGHAARADDVDRLAALGARAVRYPILWERTQPDPARPPDWRWADERLGRLRAHGVRVIAGLLHHGSGPRHTNLLDPRFPALLAGYARLVADRYPWIEDYTPVNEPLTTARFSALYGLWYPHAHSDQAFVAALLNQIEGTARAMSAIRQVVPHARLVQTEDLGKTHSTPALRYQAAFENERRWLTVDLLAGRVSREHPMWDYLTRVGEADPDRLRALTDAPCAPDLVGVNHYLTSERFLDQRIGRYPAHTHGGNGRHRYADVEAVRVLADGPAGPRALLCEAWERYGIPIAVTEAHLGCTREQQLRWLAEVWDGACAAREAGADVRAVTAWSAFGAYDWASLLTRRDGLYEPGAFDVRAPEPRPTALAAMARALATHGAFDHPALDEAGWWARDDRLQYLPVRAGIAPAVRTARRAEPRRVLITGARGTLGHALAAVCAERGLATCALTRSECDIADADSVRRALETVRPWAVVNAAGYVRVDDAEQDWARCRRENADGPAVLAEACARTGTRLVTFSSDLVFDGAGRDGRLARAYVESEAVAPLNAYGRSKAEGERRTLDALPSALVVRTSAFFGPWDEHNFVTLALRALAAGQTWGAADDLVVTPTYVPDLAHAALDLLMDDATGVWHLAGDEAMTWAELARRAAHRAGLDASLVDARPAASFGWPAARPSFAALGTERGRLMPSFASGLARQVDAWAQGREPAARAAG